MMPPGPIEGYRISIQQARSWSLLNSHGSAGSTHGASVRIEGLLDCARLESAFQLVVDRHESLRTRLLLLPNVTQPIQVIEQPEFRLGEVLDTGAVSAEARSGDEDRILADWCAANVSDPQPLRARLLSFGHDRHTLVIGLSSLCGDTESLRVLVRDLVLAYGWLSVQGEPPLQYADYAEWQHEVLQAGDEEARRYWDRSVPGELIEFRVPFERWAASPGEWQSFRLSPDSECLSTLPVVAGRLDVTVDDFLLAAWLCWLQRLTDRDELVVGVAVNGRNEQIRNACGCFARVLPLRCSLEARERFIDALQRIRRGLDEATGHSEYFSRELAFGGSSNQVSYHSCPFAFHYEPKEADQRAGDCSFQTHLGPLALLDEYKLRLSAVCRGDQLELGLDYDAGFFEAAAVQCFAGQFQTLLEGALRQPDLVLNALPLLTAGERLRVLETRKPPCLCSSPGETLHSLIEAQARHTPDAAALLHGRHAWTYAELNRRANRLARHLRSLGVVGETRVGVAFSSPFRMILGALAVLKAGGVYVPLDPGNPAERLLATVRDADPGLLLADPGLHPVLCSSRCRVTDLEGHEETPLPDEDLTDPVWPAQLAYLIYTSGSTGEPKGVAISHRSAVNSTRARLAYYPRPIEHFLLLSAFTFDSSIAGIFGTLSQGGCLCLPEDGDIQDLDRLARLIATAGVTEFLCVPSFYALLLEQLSKVQLETLQAVIIAGESFPGTLAASHHARLPAVALYNEYGPTEGTVWTSVYRSRAADEARPVPIGQAAGHVRIYVLDEQLEPLPRGVAGELYVAGEGLARGYWRRAAATAERFVPCPFGTPGARFYRTGDWVRSGVDGNLEFLGRRDDQVKIRGFRIEPGEVESRLLEHDGVREAVVLAREDQPGEKRLVAYAVPRNPGVTVEELHGFLEARLPGYMIPAALLLLPELPVSAHGKVDRKALPAPEHAIHSRYVAPRNSIEETLTEIWRKLLRVERIGVHDNFFALGGDSILSIQAVSLARQRDIVVTARQLFEHQTIAELAPLAGSGAPSLHLDGAPVCAEAPLTPIQRWFFERELPRPEFWTHALLFRLARPLDEEVLSAAVAAVLGQHDALRTRFLRIGSEWRQVLAAAPSGQAFHQIHIGTGDSLARLVETESRIPIDAGQLLRVLSVRATDSETGHLLVVIHHLVADGLTWRIVLEDLQQAYRQLLRHKPVRLPTKTASFPLWSQRFVEYASIAGLEAELPYWTDPLRAEIVPLPADHPEGANTAGGSRVVRLKLESDLTHALLHEVASAYRTQIDDLLIAALALSLSDWTRGDYFVVELDRHGREPLFEDLDISRTAGWFTSTFPVLLRVDPEASPGTTIQSVKEQLRQVPRNGIHYGALRYLAGRNSREELVKFPAAQVLFNYLGQLDQTFVGYELGVLEDEYIYAGSDPSWPRTHELSINVDVYGGMLRVECEYSGARFEKATIEGFIQRYLAWLRRLIEHCRSAVVAGYTPSDFPLAGLDQTRLDHLLSGRTAVQEVYPLTSTQQGMLFHSLYSPGSGVYAQQVSGDLFGELSFGHFREAWQEVVNRHDVLRTAFAWEDLEKPVQIVLSQAELPVQFEDWSDRSAEGQERSWQEFLSADRMRGFELGCAPLMRIHLVRLAEQRFRFLWAHHHVLLDGWCLPVIFREVLSIYRVLVSGQATRLDPARSFRDYISWLQGQDPVRAEDYWRATLAGYDQPARIQPTSPDAGAGHGEAMLVLPTEQSVALDALARKLRITPNTVVQAAWSILLGRYTGKTDVVFGVTLSGRPPDVKGVDTMLGLFINTLPVRVSVRGKRKGGDLLKALFAQNAALRDYEQTPLVDVQSWSELPRGETLFDSVVVFENYPLDRELAQRIDGVEVSNVCFREQTNYPLTLVGIPGEQLEIRLAYARSQYGAGAMQRLLGHLETLLSRLVKNTDSSIGGYELITPEEQAQFEAWSRTRLVERNDKEENLVAAFEARAKVSPDSIALRCDGRGWSYAELNAEANRLAHGLCRYGAQPEAHIGLCLHRSERLVMAILGILKTGAAYVPLDPAFPPSRLEFMAVDSECVAIVAEESCLPLLSGVRCEIYFLERQAAGLAIEPANSPSVDVYPDQAAYVIYTSGSTGLPKGVVVSHRSVMRLFGVTEGRFDFNPTDVWCLFHSYAFDFAVWEMWGALLFGGRLVIVPHDVARSAEDFHRLLCAEQVTILNQTPSSFYPLDAVDARNSSQDELALRLIVFGGEALDPARLHGWIARRGDEHPRLVNMYGITETTVHVTWQWLKSRHAEEGCASLIGRPIDDLKAYVLDCAGQKSPIGVPGEVFVGGAGLARGYLGKPGLTAERFVPDPFGREGERLYRSGDLARYRDDGMLEYLGRVDDQIKIRGYRVEPGEIEARLNAHPQVKEAVVLVREELPAKKRLVAYVVVDEDQRDAEMVWQLKKVVEQALPDYMMPAAFVFVPAIPLTVNGKRDRKAFPMPDGASQVAHRYAPAQSAAEEILVGIWSEVLGVERVGIDDNFFDLGGHSLLANQVVSRVRHAFQVELPLRSLFEHATPAELAEDIEIRLIEQLDSLSNEDAIRLLEDTGIEGL
ncbi:MAG: amino acid adenylation domain-containing protein [Methylococcales bacterium]